MARDWSKRKRSEQATQAARQGWRDWLPEQEPIHVETQTKAEIRAETDALVAAYRGPIRRLPMMAALRCRTCGHRGTARVPPDAKPAFKCSRCGSSLIAWSV
jgi:hypothetical protein